MNTFLRIAGLAILVAAGQLMYSTAPAFQPAARMASTALTIAAPCPTQTTATLPHSRPMDPGVVGLLTVALILEVLVLNLGVLMLSYAILFYGSEIVALLFLLLGMTGTGFLASWILRKLHPFWRRRQRIWVGLAISFGPILLWMLFYILIGLRS